jgi:hypothetical protein
VDSLSLSAEVRIESTKDYAGMGCRPVSMQTQKIATVVRQQNPVFRGGECKNL